MKPGRLLAVDVDYGQFYLFDSALEMANPDGEDFLADPWLHEHQCTSIGSSAIVFTMAQHGPVPVEVVALDSASDVADPAAWDHVVDMSMELPSGRLAIIGWESTGPVDHLDVTPGDSVVRILWGGLAQASESNDPTNEHLRIEVRPGTKATTRVIRGWRGWVPTEHERVATNGLPMYLGGVASERALQMERVNLSFWGDDPEIPDGIVSGVLIDRESGAHFASGRTREGHEMLRELTDDELTEITAAGEPYRLRFFMDEDGHVWNTQLPMKKTQALVYTPPENLAFIRALGGYEDEPEPLPPGWDHIVRSSLSEPAWIDVDRVGDLQTGVTYQRRRSADPPA